MISFYCLLIMINFSWFHCSKVCLLICVSHIKDIMKNFLFSWLALIYHHVQPWQFLGGTQSPGEAEIAEKVYNIKWNNSKIKVKIFYQKCSHTIFCMCWLGCTYEFLNENTCYLVVLSGNPTPELIEKEKCCSGAETFQVFLTKSKPSPSWLPFE